MRKVLFFASAFIIIVLVVFLFIFLSAKPKSQPPVPAENPTPTSIPTSDKINISNIQVSNFYKTAGKIGKSGEVYLPTDEKRYQILYTEKFNQFLISILASPFDDVRPEAEESLIKQLGISRGEACSLDVSITTPTFANPDFSGKTYKLSFCE